MARYDFKCSHCGQKYEVRLPMSEHDNPPNCSYCGGELKRVWAIPNVIYSDEGFTQFKGRNKAGEPIVERK